VLVKQSAFDGGLAAVLFLLVTERRRGVGRAGVIAAAAFVPVVAAALSAPNLHDWWSAVVAYRAHGDSLVTGSPVHRLGMFIHSVPEALKGLGLLALLTGIGWGRAPLLARLWLGAAAIGFLGGGNFHAHYYIQFAPPLAVLGAVGVRRLLDERRSVAVAACAAAAAASIALTAPLWFAGDTAQARAIWPNDPHLRNATAVAAYVRSHTKPGQPIFTLWAAADLYYLADRRPLVPYMWFRNIETVSGALDSARRRLAAREPALVVLIQRPRMIDDSGET